MDELKFQDWYCSKDCQLKIASYHTQNHKVKILLYERVENCQKGKSKKKIALVDKQICIGDIMKLLKTYMKGIQSIHWTQQ